MNSQVKHVLGFTFFAAILFKAASAALVAPSEGGPRGAAGEGLLDFFLAFEFRRGSFNFLPWLSFGNFSLENLLKNLASFPIVLIQTPWTARNVWFIDLY